MLNQFYRNKRIFVTGNTGFKGAILCQILYRMGAEIQGYSLNPVEEPSLYAILGQERYIPTRIGDVRDYDSLKAVFDEFQPEMVIHLAAQPLVRESYRDPVYTYETNVMGTVNVCECIRHCETVKSFLNVTTDKVYQNEETGIPFTEDMPLKGHDPYSNSKSCSELVTYSYAQAFLQKQGVAVSTARAGNVIGGGDFAKERIIPDCVRAAMKGESIVVRNPGSVRPYQHVLEPLYAYLMIVMEQYHKPELQGNYNVGPDEESILTTGELVDLFCKYWGHGLDWVNKWDGGPYEAGCLRLDCSRLKNTFSWKPAWTVEKAVEKTVEWYRAYYEHKDMGEITDRQIGEMFNV